MLAEFRVSNYRSFKDEQVLSLIAVSDESMGKNSVQVGNHRILKTAVVYGANASGKSNLTRAMACMNDIVKNSAEYKLGEKIPVTPFHFDEKTKNKPSSFEVTFFIDGIRYQYGFLATTDKIFREWLLAWPKGREQTWFERDCNEPEPYFGPSLKGQNKSIWSKVKDNSLFLSVASQWNHEQLSNVYKWFFFSLVCDTSNLAGTFQADKMLMKTDGSKDKAYLRALTIKLLKLADFGIDDLQVELEMDDSGRILNSSNKLLKAIKDEVNFLPVKRTAYHLNKKYSLSFEDESDGTKKFYSFIGILIYAIKFGYTIIKDELELNLHPLLTRTLLKSVRDFEIDGTCAQLIFTTHDTTLLDPGLFGRDQVWFTEKGKDGATRLYSLADYKDVRKGEAMQKRYLAGRYGAVPILERFDLVGEKK